MLFATTPLHRAWCRALACGIAAALAAATFAGANAPNAFAATGKTVHGTASARLSETFKMLYPKKSATLSVKGAKKVKWKSSNPLVATVSAKGKVSARQLGQCTVTAKVGGISLSCRIEVTSKSAYEAVKNAYRDIDTRITYSQARRMDRYLRDCSSFVSRCYWDPSLGRKLLVIGGDSARSWALTAAGQALWLERKGRRIAYAGVGTSQLLCGDTIHYQTGYAGLNHEYRHIDHVALYIGGGYIADTAGVGGRGCIGRRYYLTGRPIRFIGRPDAQFMLDKSSVKLARKKKVTLKGLFAGKAITWKSSEKSVATVNKKGTVTAKKRGTAIITAKSGNASYRCQITVS